MNDEQLRQRINYLVEHGGLWDDPLDTIRKQARWAVVLAIISSVLHLIDLAVILR